MMILLKLQLQIIKLCQIMDYFLLYYFILLHLLQLHYYITLLHYIYVNDTKGILNEWNWDMDGI